MNQAAADLEAAISQFLSEHDEEFVSVNRVINPLLHLWKLASDLSPATAVPVEQLLTTLTGRKLVKRTELSEAMQALRDAAEDIEIADLDAPSVV